MNCTAKRQNGSQCKAPAIKGGSVCRVHGGSAPQVKEAARIRLLEMVDPALAVLTKSMKQQTKQPQVALAAAKDVLDRAGFKPTDRVEVDVTTKSWADTLRERRAKRAQEAIKQDP